MSTQVYITVESRDEDVELEIDCKHQSMTLEDAFKAMSIEMPPGIIWDACSRDRACSTMKDIMFYLEKAELLITVVGNSRKIWSSMVNDDDQDGKPHIQRKVDIADAMLKSLTSLRASLSVELRFKRFRRRMSRWSGWVLGGSLIIAFAHLWVLPLFGPFIPDALGYCVLVAIVMSTIDWILAVWNS